MTTWRTAFQTAFPAWEILQFYLIEAKASPGLSVVISPKLSPSVIVLCPELSCASTASEGLQHSVYSSSTEIYKDILRSTDQQNLIFDVATSFISHGGPSHRIQPVIEALGEVLDIPTTVYSMNTHTILSFPPKGRRGPPTIYTINKRGSMNFTKLPHVFKLVKDMIRKPEGTSVDNIYGELKRIEEMENAWGQYAIAASYVPAAATSAIMFFGGDWKDAAMSGTLAIIPALLLLVANKWERLWVWTLSSHPRSQLLIIVSFICSGLTNALPAS